MRAQLKSFQHSLIWLAACASVAACTSNTDSVDASEAIATAELNETQGGLMPDALLPRVFPVPLDGDLASTPEQAAAQVGSAVAESFEPAGCAAVTVQGATVTYALNGCTPNNGMGQMLHPDHGRKNRHGLSASFTLTFSQTEQGLGVDIVGSKVSGRQSEFELTGKGTLELVGTQRVLTITTQGTGQGPHGEALQRQGNQTRSYDTATGCFALDGVWSMDGPRGHRERSVSGYVQCGDSCPRSGVVVGDGMRRHGHGKGKGHMGEGQGQMGGGSGPPSDVGGPDDVTVTVEFDGSAEPGWVAGSGETGTLTLACSPTSS